MYKYLEYEGTRWYKCDFHLHTVESKCFQDKSATPEEWINAAIEKGLNCVAVTDHNTGNNIDAIKIAAKNKDITVFPGVEITCDSAKVHLLILFDVTKTSADIRDFLVRADIRAQDFGEQQASSVKSIFEIARLAKNDGAIVIPAHIDEYNGLGDVSVGNLKKLFTEYDINAVQIVHNEFLRKNFKTTNNAEIKEILNNYYGSPTPSIDDSTVKKWFTPVKYALEENIALLTFSDNPHEPHNSQHGLWGIGNHYTWIKMDNPPSLEGLRQAFLLPDFRVKNKFTNPNMPYSPPDIWIKSVSINSTLVTDTSSSLLIRFNPQLNTIIGGRGSGKSSVLRFIRGVFNRTYDITVLDDILKDHNDFYKPKDSRTKKGVLSNNSIITVEIVRNNILHKITASNIKASNIQDIEIKKYSIEADKWEIVEDEGYIDFLNFEQYSQKQIYEIAQEPNALRERIDSSLPDIDRLQNELKEIKNKFFEKSLEIRKINDLLSDKGKTKTKIKDLDESINKLQKSGIATILHKKDEFSKEEVLINNFHSSIKEKEDLLTSLMQEFNTSNIDLTNFSSLYKNSVNSIADFANNSLADIKRQLSDINTKIGKVSTNFDESIKESLWKKDFDENIESFNNKKRELESEGIDDISNFEKLTSEKEHLTNHLIKINSQEENQENNIVEKNKLNNDCLRIRKKITKKRQDFVSEILNKDNTVKITVKPFRNKNDFEYKIRKIIQKENTSFQDDIDKLSDICFQGNVEKKIEDVRTIFLNIRNDEQSNEVVSGRFINMVKGLNDEQVDEIEFFLPEDEIEIQYKPTKNLPFKSLSTASAGQKTTAILTFILSYGSVPLILDQPEDDLDNRLVYDLIVDRLKKAKENRQLIVVTHNANIPVNGDAEYIISMDTESKKLSVLHEGTVDQSSIKKEICDVMEGSEKAFKMRSKRYKEIG